MARLDELGPAPLLMTGRLRLEPLRAGHAQALAPLLDDPALHVYTGGEPDSASQLRSRHRRQLAGRSPDGTQRWLNWVVCLGQDGPAVGTLQATVTEPDRRLAAELAWVVAVPQQGHGYAQEAAQAVVAWLRGGGVEVVTAHVHLAHEASMAVARALGLTATAEAQDGEVRWQG